MRFLRGLDSKAKTFAPSARATVEANDELCSWLLDPLARWAEAAYGDRAFEDAAKGYAKYCMGVWKSQQLYEKNGRYTPESMPELVSEVYEHEGYMVPYMWAAILIYPFWPSMINHIALYRDDFMKALPPDAKGPGVGLRTWSHGPAGSRDQAGHPGERFRYQSAGGGCLQPAAWRLRARATV